MGLLFGSGCIIYGYAVRRHAVIGHVGLWFSGG